MSNATNLQDYPVVIEIPIAWGDMDAFQHVNNTVYFRLFESSRIAYFNELGFLQLMTETGIGPILASTSCKFILPLTYPDTVSVGAKVADIQEQRFTMKHIVFSHQHRKTAATGEGNIVTFDYSKNQKATIPDLVYQKIMELEKTL